MAAGGAEEKERLRLPWYCGLAPLRLQFYERYGFEAALTGAVVGAGGRAGGDREAQARAAPRRLLLSLCMHFTVLIIVLALPTAALFAAKTNFVGPVRAMGGEGVAERIIGAFPDGLVVSWDPGNRSILWEVVAGSSENEPGLGKHIEIDLPWDHFLMAWSAALPDPFSQSVALVHDLLLALNWGDVVQYNGAEWPLLQDPFVRVDEFRQGDSALVRRVRWPEPYGGWWDHGTVIRVTNLTEPNTTLYDVVYTVRLDDPERTQVNVSALDLRMPKYSLVLTPTSNMTVQVPDEETVGVPAEQQVGGTNQTRQATRLWESKRAPVVITPEKIFLFSGYSFANGGFWRYPHTDPPPVVQSLTPGAIESFRPLWVLSELYCRRQSVAIPAIPCKIGDRVRAVWQGNGKRYDGVIERDDRTRNGSLHIEWTDGDTRYKSVPSLRVYRNGFPCDESPSGEPLNTTVTDLNATVTDAMTDTDAIGYSEIIRCSREDAASNVAEFPRLIWACERWVHAVVLDVVVYIAICISRAVTYALTVAHRSFFAYCIVNLLRHADSPGSRFYGICCLVGYASTPFIIAREAFIISSNFFAGADGNVFIDSTRHAVKIGVTWAAEWHLEPILFQIWIAYIVISLRRSEDRRREAERVAINARRALQSSDVKNEEESNETPSCRICFGGPDDGHLVSPCLCHGSMRWVHVECLQQWRQLAPNSRAFYECDLCHYRYAFYRAKYAQVLRSALVLRAVALLALAAVVFAATWGARAADSPALLNGAISEAIFSNATTIWGDDIDQDLITEQFPEGLDMNLFMTQPWVLGFTLHDIVRGAACVGLVGQIPLWSYTILFSWRSPALMFLTACHGLYAAFSMLYRRAVHWSGRWLASADSQVVEVGAGFHQVQSRIVRQIQASRGDSKRLSESSGHVINGGPSRDNPGGPIDEGDPKSSGGGPKPPAEKPYGGGPKPPAEKPYGGGPKPPAEKSYDKTYDKLVDSEMKPTRRRGIDARVQSDLWPELPLREPALDGARQMVDKKA